MQSTSPDWNSSHMSRTETPGSSLLARMLRALGG